MSSNAVATGPVFDSWWLGPYRESRPIQQTAALDLLLAVVEEGVSVGFNHLVVAFVLGR